MGGGWETFTSAQSTWSTLVTEPCSVCRSMPTPVRSCDGAPPGHRTSSPTTTAAAKGIRTAAITLRRCWETGAAGPWLWEWPWPPVGGSPPWPPGPDGGPPEGGCEGGGGGGVVEVTGRSSQESARPTVQHGRRGVSVEPPLYTRELGAPG